MMLKKENRVNRQIIEHIFKRGAFVNTPNLTFKFILQKDLKNRAISFFAPKSSTKSAVKRNLLRRRGYIALKRQWNFVPHNIVGVFIFNKKGSDLFSGKKTKTYDPTQDLENEIKNIFNKIN